MTSTKTTTTTRTMQSYLICGSNIKNMDCLDQLSPKQNFIDREEIKMPRYRIRRMIPEDVQQVLEIWAENDLHEGMDTIQSFMFADPDGFIVAVEVSNETKIEGEINFEPQQTSEPIGSLKLLTETTTKDDNVEKDHEMGRSEKRSLFPTKQICCCAVQTPNSPPLSDNLISKSTSLQAIRQTEKRILGMCVGVFVNPTIAFVGLYAVRPELHGRGIGLSMWKRMMEHIGDRNVGLYAVEKHLSMYRDRAGFRSPDDRKLFIYESNNADCLNTDLLVNSIRGIEVYPIDEKLCDHVIRYDEKVHGYSRQMLLPQVFKENGSVSLVALDVDDIDVKSAEHFSVQGYGCIRTNNIGKAMIGPVYASNDAVAELLMRCLFESLPGPFSQGLLYMTLDSNPGGERIADKLGLQKHEELPRFFRHKPYVDAQWTNVYCIHSPNFSLL